MINRIKFKGDDFEIYDFPYEIPEIGGNPIEFEQENGNGGALTTTMLRERHYKLVNNT